MSMSSTYFVKRLSLSEIRTHFKTYCPRTTKKLSKLKMEAFPEGEMLRICPDQGQGSLLSAIFVHMKTMVQNMMVGSFCPALIR